MTARHERNVAGLGIACSWPLATDCVNAESRRSVRAKRRDVLDNCVGIALWRPITLGRFDHHGSL